MDLQQIQQMLADQKIANNLKRCSNLKKFWETLDFLFLPKMLYDVITSVIKSFKKNKQFKLMDILNNTTYKNLYV